VGSSVDIPDGTGEQTEEPEGALGRGEEGSRDRFSRNRSEERQRSADRPHAPEGRVRVPARQTRRLPDAIRSATTAELLRKEKKKKPWQ